MIFVVTHNLLEVEQYTDRYILLNEGKVIRNVSTSVMSNDFASNVMIISLQDIYELNDLPEAENSEYRENEMQLIMTLSEKQIPNAVNWLMKLIQEGKVLNYKLTSATLDMQYGGMIDGK